MCKSNSEAASLTKRSSRLPSVFNHGKAAKCRLNRCGVRHAPKRNPNLEQRFKTAFSKALAVRSRVLGRRLTREEWVKLKHAVRYQCFGPTVPLQKQLTMLATRVARCERLVPASISSVADSIELMYQQLSLLRAQAMELMSERESIAPSCPHFRKRKVFPTPSNQLQIGVKPLGWHSVITYRLQGRDETLCCGACLQARSDAWFSWTGEELRFEHFLEGDDIPGKEQLLRSLSAISPLSIQGIWSQILLQKYGSDFSE
uniref:Uncharacterized protein n=1 Tax=Aspergillus fumigatus partitivirus 1 TaxID=1027415 RepID=A0A6S6UK86_9VIRU|nr:unknown [Aspergillus fumigatus partitivirus 1]